MKTILIQIRDTMTKIPALVTIISPGMIQHGTRNQKILANAGIISQDVVLLTRLSDFESHASPYDWGNSRTMKETHLYISMDRNYRILEDGAVIDVEYILNETKQPKEFE